ncbi:MAG: helix-turn-helix domain-containing protein [Pseudonocardiaceae bacterium]|nr:helix-turn-helix domain-containing protein [Pseudonocardiaceae bacterium]
MREDSTLRSAEHALKLVLLATRRGQVTVSEVKRELGVGASTAHRLLATCRRVGFVRQDVVGGPYLVGPAVHELTLAATSAVTLRDAAAPVLLDLRAAIDETVSMLVLEGNHVRFVQSLEGQQTVRVGARLGKVLPAHCTAGGKAMLAALSEDELHERYQSRHLRTVSQRSISDWPALTRQLKMIRRRGWATNFGEGDPSIGAIAASVLLSTGEPVAAVAAAAPLARLTTAKEAEALAPHVLEAASVIQRRLRGSV